jgi:rSAM/selenodomain-associated transferase 2
VISVIIPALDEELALPATLDSLRAQRTECEVILVDGGSSDRTLEIFNDFRKHQANWHAVTSARGRARQQNAGAVAATGGWLLFLHADTRLPPGGLERIMSVADHVHAGCFRHRFSGASRMLAVLTWFHNRRFAVTHVIYGDQAMFIRRSLFHEIGGFPDGDMEDIAFSLRLRRVTKPIMLDAAIVTDARKFEQMGHWRALYRAVSLLVRFRFGRDVSSDPFFDPYR